MMALLHPDVTWIAPAGNATQVGLGEGRPDEAGAPSGTNTLGREAIVDFMSRRFAPFFRDASMEFLSMTAEHEVVVAEFRLSATLPNGRPYVNEYCFVHEVVDGQVMRIREYMDTRGGWVQVFGDAEPGPLS